MINIINLIVEDTKTKRRENYYFGENKKLYLKHTTKLDVLGNGRVRLKLKTDLYVDKEKTKKVNDFLLYKVSNYNVTLDDYKETVPKLFSFDYRQGNYNECFVEFLKCVPLKDLKIIIKNINAIVGDRYDDIINAYVNNMIVYNNARIEYTNKSGKRLRDALTIEIENQGDA